MGLPTHLRLIEVVGAGGSGTVWRARDRRAGRDVAVKVIELGSAPAAGGPGPAERWARFEREARALARLRGVPGVVAAQALGSDADGPAWIVTDLWPGGTLADRSFPLPADEVITVGGVLAGALARAHDLEVVHGDVTPANVLFDAHGGVGLADFGVAVLLGGRTASGPGDGVDPFTPAPFGPAPFTPAYAAPEVRDGAGPSTASDVYGLGATLRAAAGPARGLAEVAARCCAAEPADRPTSAEVVAMLAVERRRRARATRGRPAAG